MQNLASRRDKLTYFSTYFIIFAVLGYIYETLLFFVYGNPVENRGFLFGPYLPIYGFSILFLLFLYFKVFPYWISKGPRLWQGIKAGLITGVAATLVELVVGFGLDKIWGLRLWDYSEWPYNFKGYISLNHSIRFALFGVLIYLLLIPLIDKLIGKIGYKPLSRVNLVIIVIMLIDFIIKLI